MTKPDFSNTSDDEFEVVCGSGYTPDSTYYCEDVILLVETYLFRIPCAILEQSSTFTLRYLDAMTSSSHGLAMSDPIFIKGYKAEDFRQLLRVLLPLQHGIKTTFSAAQCMSILKLSTEWQFHSVRQSMIEELLLHTRDDPILKIIAAKKYGVLDWLVPAINALAQRDEALDEVDVQRFQAALDEPLEVMRLVINIAKVRETLFNRPTAAKSRHSWPLSAASPCVTWHPCHYHGTVTQCAGLTGHVGSRSKHNFTAAICNIFGCEPNGLPTASTHVAETASQPEEDLDLLQAENMRKQREAEEAGSMVKAAEEKRKEQEELTKKKGIEEEKKRREELEAAELAERLRLEEEAAELKRHEAAAEHQRLIEEAERVRLADEEEAVLLKRQKEAAERQRLVEEEAEYARLAEAKAEQQRLAEAEAERKRQEEAEAAEHQRKADEEAVEAKRKAEEAERESKAADEALRKAEEVKRVTEEREEGEEAVVEREREAEATKDQRLQDAAIQRQRQAEAAANRKREEKAQAAERQRRAEQAARERKVVKEAHQKAQRAQTSTSSGTGVKKSRREKKKNAT